MVHSRFTGGGTNIINVSITMRRRKAEGREPSYYYAVQDPVTGRYSNSKKSVKGLAKKLGLRYDKINKRDAEHIVEEGKRKGLITIDAPIMETGATPLIPFIEKILAYDTSPWVAEESKRKGIAHSKKYVRKLETAFRIHAKPLIDSSKTLITFTKADAKALQDKMLDNHVSANNITAAINGIKTAYNYAMERGIVEANPVNQIKPFISKPKEKRILSRVEAKKVLEVLERHAVESPTRRAAYLGTKLAIYAGMREGEIRAFSLRQLSRVLDEKGMPTAFYKIDVDVSWDDEMKAVGPTKGRYKRTTVIHSSLANELIDFAEDTDRVESNLLFRSFIGEYTDIERPLVKNIFQDYFYEALREIGIDNETRKARGIDFHSLRHFYDSESKAVAQKMEIYVKEIREAIGHKSKSVDELIYTHDTPTRLVTIGVMSEHILDVD